MQMPSTRSIVRIVCCALLIACKSSGKIEADSAPTSGAGGSGAAAGSGGAAGGSGMLGPAGASGATDVEGSAGSSGAKCPAKLPIDGSACAITNRISVPLICHFGECPAGTLGGPLQEASCDGSKWTVTELECPSAIECGECPAGMTCGASCMPGETCDRNQCPIGQVCLKMLYPDGHFTWDCAPNHCDAQALDCSCAGTVCAQRALPGDWQCTAAAPPTIICECVGGC